MSNSMSKISKSLSDVIDQYALKEGEHKILLNSIIESKKSKGDLWVFGYGALMWRPGFPYKEKHFGIVHGYHRSFCVFSHFHRGSRELPGLVLGLDLGGSCKGMLYRVSAVYAEKVVEYLIKREMETNAYAPSRVKVRAGGLVTLAHTYIVMQKHTQYAGKLTLEKAAKYIRGNHGQSGSNADYLRKTINHLEKMRLNTDFLKSIQNLVEN